MKRASRVAIALSILISALSSISLPATVAVSANPTPNCSAGTTCTITFTFTGDYYAWSVPNGVNSLTVVANGAKGGNTTVDSTQTGGSGGRVNATLAVTGGEQLYIYVGGVGIQGPANSNSTSGGFNGGGLGGKGNGSNSPGAGGGGASDIRTIVGDLSSRLIVAGGGGGAGYYGGGGAGGGLSGGNGFIAPSGSSVSTGGTQSSGGTGNTWSGWGTSLNGSLGIGGDAHSTSPINGGGGGGGGYYGGGGGSWVGAAGGSSFSHATRASSVTHTQGANSGAGQITVTYLNSPIPTTFSTSQASPTNISTGTTLSYSLIFSQSVTGLATSDFQFGGTSTCNTPGLSGSGTTYTVTVTNCSEGSLILQLKANSVTGTSSGPPAVSSANTVVIDRTAPTISSVSAPASSTYSNNQTPTFTMVFSESVTVTGSPRLTLTVGTVTKYATFLSLSDSKTATFRYTVSTDPLEFDTDGISVLTSLDLNGGSIADLASNAISNLTFTAPTLTSVYVAQLPIPPTIDSVVATSGTLTVYFTPGAARGSTTQGYQYTTDNNTFKNRETGSLGSPLVITTVSTGATGLVNGTGYRIRIRAVTNAGNSAISNLVNETPTAIVVTGDSTLSLTYGNSASTSAYSATGGTNTFTWSLGSSLTGVSLSGTTVTASASTPAGTYTQTVRATDGNSQVGSKTLTITVAKASTTISIALPNSSTTAAAGGAVTITATVSRAGSVNFKIGGVTISGCGAAAAASTTATCSWTAPGSLGGVTLSADFTPTDSANYETSTTGSVSITVVDGISTVTLSLAGGTTTPPKGQTINIIAAVDQAGRITFLIDGKRIPGCNNKVATVGNVTCSWKPAIQKQSTITARLVPTNNIYTPSTSSLKVQVVRRSGTR